jgi:hypothetical protein
MRDPGTELFSKEEKLNPEVSGSIPGATRFSE